MFTGKNKRCYVSLLTSYIRPSHSSGDQTVTMMNLNIYCF